MLDTNKRAAFLDFLDLPRRVKLPMEIATVIGPDEQDDRVLLEDHGWVVRKAAGVVGDPAAYRSLAEVPALSSGAPSRPT